MLTKIKDGLYIDLSKILSLVSLKGKSAHSLDDNCCSIEFIGEESSTIFGDADLITAKLDEYLEDSRAFRKFFNVQPMPVADAVDALYGTPVRGVDEA